MTETRFTVPGPPQGYYAQGKTPNWRRMKRYHAYMVLVQQCAALAGLRLPLRASRERPVVISVWSYFASGVHCDPGNVQKGVCDALFWAPRGQRKGGGDKYTGGSFSPPRYDKLNPRVEVEVLSTTSPSTEPSTDFTGMI